MSRAQVSNLAVTYLLSSNVDKYCAVILNAGTELKSLMELEFPYPGSVRKALFGVVKVVEAYGLKGKWVMSWLSSAQEEFVMTPEIRSVSRLPFFV